MQFADSIVGRVREAVCAERLLETAVGLIEIPSPTRSARAVADRLAEILDGDGFSVERPAAGWTEAPAVVTRLHAQQPGRTLQFNGHLHTVHLPFIPPRVEDGKLYGSGAADMKGGIAAMVEALRALRDSDTLPAGSVLLTAHELHENPWGDGSQVDALIDAGFVGDGVLLPEYLCDCLPIIGRGLAVLTITVRRSGQPVHEVLGGIDEPSVIQAGAEIITRFAELDGELASKTDPLAGRESLFIGQIAAGEIYNQAPTELALSGTRRWLPGTAIEQVEQQYQQILAEVAQKHGLEIAGRFQVARDAFEISDSNPLARSFQLSYGTVTGNTLPLGAKPFVDDGNAFVRRGGVPAVTHGHDAQGAHSLHEEVPVDELVRVAIVYALTAISFCADA